MFGVYRGHRYGDVAMPTAYSYVRFSRPEQLRGDSLRRRPQAAEAWADKQGLELDESLTDLGVSAYRALTASLVPWGVSWRWWRRVRSSADLT